MQIMGFVNEQDNGLAATQHELSPFTFALFTLGGNFTSFSRDRSLNRAAIRVDTVVRPGRFRPTDFRPPSVCFRWPPDSTWYEMDGRQCPKQANCIRFCRYSQWDFYPHSAGG